MSDCEPLYVLPAHPNAPRRFIFPAEGEWDIVTDCETASVIDEQIRADEEAGRLSVRSHPWLKVGTVVAFRKDELGAFKIGPY